MDSRGFPALWADDKYTIYFEKIFGENRERQRKYINAILSENRVSLSVGNRVFGALLASSLCRVAFTTNFDTVVEKAVAEIGGQSLSAYHLEGPHAANNALNNEEYPLYCKLHGDFRYDSLKNLSQDLERPNDELSSCLVNAGSRVHKGEIDLHIRGAAKVYARCELLFPYARRETDEVRSETTDAQIRSALFVFGFRDEDLRDILTQRANA